MFQEIHSELKKLILNHFCECESLCEEATSARCIMATLLSEKGFSDREISRLMGISRQSANKLRQGFENRKMNSWYFRVRSEQIRKEFAIICQKIASRATDD
jgi:predicted transcriptional regulator